MQLSGVSTKGFLSQS